ncbi:hypothetical protein [Caballeronia sp. TF1N1]|uniref:hypothetical protein n=1 Tax=Caballeronia sp. TF1N1 TaxID=2878153 RepID=UPI001FD53CF1|nr:hypothetical protein [Caballeronia sp. TF1N1]
MTRANPLANLESDPLENLDAFKPKSEAEPKSTAEKRAVEQNAIEKGFVSRKAEPARNTDRERPRYYRNGRNVPLNFKVTEDVKEQLHRLRDELDQPLGVVLEEALNALEEKKAEVIERLYAKR